MLIEAFCQLSRLERYQFILIESFGFERGMGQFERKYQGERGRPTTAVDVSRLRVPGLSRGVVCLILCLAVLIEYRRMTNRQTDTQTHDDCYCPR